MTLRAHERPAAHLRPAIIAAIPVLETPRLTLRAPRLADFDLLAALCTGPRSAGIGGPLDRDEAWGEFMQMTATWVLRGHGWWAVTEAEALMGFVGLGFEPGDQEPELGYMFAEAAEGRGLATEAVEAARDWAREAGLPSLVSYIADDNDRSLALAQRVGAVRDRAAERALVASLGDAEAGTQVWRHAVGGTQ